MEYPGLVTDTGELPLIVQTVEHGPLTPMDASQLPDIKPRINEFVTSNQNPLASPKAFKIQDIKRRVDEHVSPDQFNPTMFDFPLDVKFKLNSEDGTAGPPLRSILAGASDLDGLRKTIDAREVKELELSVEEGERFLESTSLVLVKHVVDCPEFNIWIKQIQKIREMKKTPQVKIGLYGVTGAGKSTLINALLCRPLLHCNAMRAGTAAITEIMYMDDEKYRAEIELVSVEEWEQELKVLLSDLRESSTSTAFMTKNNKVDESSSAWAKVTAVYPHLERDRVAKMSVSEVMAQQDLQNFLGTTKVFEEKNLRVFSKILKQYTNGTSQESKVGGKKSSDPPFWPFVKRATIKLKAAALETGVVLYDLPGCGDTNAARTQIAENFMQNLDHIWVLADINRACDDAIARNLLGAPFRRQLKMDGNYNDEHISFIMTKTDNITSEDVIEDLELEDQVRKENSQIRKLSRKLQMLTDEINDKTTRFAKNQSKQGSITKSINSIKSINKSNQLESSMQDIKAPSDRELRYLKRKHSNDDDEHAISPPPKVRKSGKESGPRLGNRGQSPSQIVDLVAEQREIRHFQGLWKKNKDGLFAMRDDVDRELKEWQIKLKKICIQQRNKYAIERIREDFAAGQNECEREFADENDEVLPGCFQTQTTSEKLQVFAVSSKAYLVLSKKLPRETDLNGLFMDDDTSIPELQIYCRKMTLKKRREDAVRFVKALRAMQAEMKEWGEDRSTENQVSPEQKVKLQDLLGKELINFRQRAFSDLEVLIERYRTAVTGPIFRGLRQSVQHASAGAKSTVKSWTTGGLACATWKAICVRLGVFVNSKKVRYDWNEELCEPFFTHFQGPWNETFNNLFPDLKQTYLVSLQLLMDELVESLKVSSASINRATYRPLEAIFGQYQGSNEELDMDLTVAFEEIKHIVNGLHRRLKPYIQSDMTVTYEYGCTQRGKGSYALCKSHMENHMDQDGHSMYANAERLIKRKLKDTSGALKEKIQSALDATCDRIEASFNVVLSTNMTDEPLVVRAAKRQLQIWMMGKLFEYQNFICPDTKIDSDVDMRAIKVDYERVIDYDDYDDDIANSDLENSIDDREDYSESAYDADSDKPERFDPLRLVDGNDESRGLGLARANDGQEVFTRPAAYQSSYVSDADADDKSAEW